jgi:hypothetical protein
MDTPATTTLLAKMTSCSRPRTVTLTAWLVNGTSMIGTAALANLRRLAARRLEGVLRAGGTAHPREVRRRGRISRHRLGRGARCERAMSAR